MADPNTLSALTSMQPGTVSAYGDILKTIMAMNPILGGAAAFIFAYFANKHTKAIKSSVEAKGPSPEDLAKFKADLEKISFESLSKFDALGKAVSERIEKSHRETVQSLDDGKIKAMRLSKNMDAKVLTLSKAQSVSEAMEQRVSRLEQVHAEFAKRFQRRDKK